MSFFVQTRVGARALMRAALAAAGLGLVFTGLFAVERTPAKTADPVATVRLTPELRRSLSDAALQHVTLNTTLAPASRTLRTAAARARIRLPAAPPFHLVAADGASRDLDCLTAAVYYEARGESLEGQAAVAQVVLNRVRNPIFPRTVCAVVYQGATSGACQFSFACDGQMDRLHEPAAWARARSVAGRALAGYVMEAVGRATHFRVASLGAVWSGQMVRVAQVGQHIFFGFAGRRGALRPDLAQASPPLSLPAAPSATANDASRIASAQTPVASPAPVDSTSPAKTTPAAAPTAS